MIDEREQLVYETLNELGISYVRYEHPPIYTVEEAKKLELDIVGAKCKNLFLKSKRKEQYYILIAEEDKRVDLKGIAKEVGAPGLYFAPAEKLYEFLTLTPGSVTPFGVLNDLRRVVSILIDQDLTREDVVTFHPNVNTATIGIAYKDLEKFLTWNNTIFHCIKI